jgi:regulator of Ty1 transposition protein 103
MVSSSAAVTSANTEYDKMQDPSYQVPTPPVHAARLSQLLKSLATAESSVSEIIKARKTLIQGLEKLLDTNRSALTKEQSHLSELLIRKGETEGKKREVEDGIMRGLSVENSPAIHGNGDASSDGTVGVSEGDGPERPEVEALTPPPVEALTPVMSPKLNPVDKSDSQPKPDHDNHSDLQPFPVEAFPPQPTVENRLSVAGADLISSLTMPHSRPQSGSPVKTSSVKKRKVSHADEDYAEFVGGDAMADLDADVAELLRQESSKY